MASFMLMDASMTTSLIQFAADLSLTSTLSIHLSDLLLMVSKGAPQTFHRAPGPLSEWLQQASLPASSGLKAEKDTHRGVYLRILTILKAVSRGTMEESEEQSELCGTILKMLKTMIDPEVGEGLAEIAVQLALCAREPVNTAGTGTSHDQSSANQQEPQYQTSLELTIAALKNLLSPKHLSLSNRRLSTDLFVLSSFIQLPTVVYQNYDSDAYAKLHACIMEAKESLLSFVREDLLEAGEDSSQSLTDKGLNLAVSAGLKSITAMLVREAGFVKIHNGNGNGKGKGKGKVNGVVTGGRSKDTAKGKADASEESEESEEVATQQETDISQDLIWLQELLFDTIR